jgi:2-C-methyl-D-erythritol 2,4-cyclodiphosphate synthase
MLRIGQGYDIHRLVEGRPLRLGCIQVPFERGTSGHSDGDAAAHALCDALLGAAAMGDMGALFPSTDPQWKDTESRVFVREVARRLGEAGGSIVNVDITVVLERPRLADLLESMRTALADALDVEASIVSVKAKSGDGLGEVGAGNAVEAYAVALIDL